MENSLREKLNFNHRVLVVAPWGKQQEWNVEVYQMEPIVMIKERSFDVRNDAEQWADLQAKEYGAQVLKC